MKHNPWPCVLFVYYLQVLYAHANRGFKALTVHEVFETRPATSVVKITCSLCIYKFTRVLKSVPNMLQTECAPCAANKPLHVQLVIFGLKADSQLLLYVHETDLTQRDNWEMHSK